MILGQRRGTSQILLACGAAVWLSAMVGCASGPGEASSGDRFGRTYYIDGAGNWGYGVVEMQEGLRRAGYRGSVITWHWSPTFNPALDQTIGRPVAQQRGRELGEEINRYRVKYPGNEVNIIALSAGTGVAVWACETVRSPAAVKSLILLGSSISSNYDMRKALEHITGGVYVYYSHSDQVLLGPVRALGTIDGKMGVDGAGLVGLHPPGGASGRIHNIGWEPRYERYGWTGAHTDATCEPFVRMVLGPQHILQAGAGEHATTTQPADPPAHLAAHHS